MNKKQTDMRDDLLAALKNLLKAVEWSETKPVHNLTKLGRAMAKAKTVIAKAEAP